MPAAADEGAIVLLATVESIDQATRVVTLRFSDDTKSTFVASDEVRNLGQVKKGDLVIIEYYAGLAVALEPKGTADREASEEIAAARAKPGERPGAAVMESVQLVGHRTGR
jgi:hypothetical protein